MKPKKEEEKDYDKNYQNRRHDVQTLRNAHKKALEALDGVIFRRSEPHRRNSYYYP